MPCSYANSARTTISLGMRVYYTVMETRVLILVIHKVVVLTSVLRVTGLQDLCNILVFKRARMLSKCQHCIVTGANRFAVKSHCTVHSATSEERQTFSGETWARNSSSSEHELHEAHTQTKRSTKGWNYLNTSCHSAILRYR